MSGFSRRGMQTGGMILVVGVLLIAWTVFVTKSRNADTDVPFVDLREVAPASYSTPGSSDTDDSVLHIAVGAMISPKSTAEYYRELLILLGDRVGQEVEFAQKKTYAEVNDMVERREVDLAFVCSGPYVVGHDLFDMEILVVPQVHGKTEYHSYFIAHRDSSLGSLEDLRGKRFAFTDPHSNTGCLVPRYVLAQKGETPESFFGEFFYTYSHDNSIKAVAEGLADGAAVDHLIWEFMNQVDPEFTAATKIIAKSEPYGIPPVVVHPDLDPGLKTRFRETLLSIHEDPEAASILSLLQIERFRVGNDSDYDSVRRMQEWVEEMEHGAS